MEGFQKDVGKERALGVGGRDKKKGSRKIGVMCAGSKGTRLRASETKTSSETEKPSRVRATGSQLDTDDIA